MAGSAVNLSLLSRGIGEVKRNGHEKIDVVLEPEVGVTIFEISIYICVTSLIN